MNQEANNKAGKLAMQDILQLVTFHLGNEEFAVDILNIQGINRMVQITRVPNAPSYVVGIINLRGQVIPLIDLRKRLGMPDRVHDKQTRFIVVEINAVIIGFIVDSVNEVLRISKSVIEQPPAISESTANNFIFAIAKLNDRLISLLDLSGVLTGEEKKELQELS